MSAHREHVGDAKLANNADACFDLKLLFACWGVQVVREARSYGKPRGGPRVRPSLLCPAL